MNALPERHRTLLMLALPMIIANISQPILGMVDTAVLGHLGEVGYLAGAAVGAFVVSQCYWLCGFFRQSMTGIAAQDKGERSVDTSANGFGDDIVRGMLIALCIGVGLIVTSPWLIDALLSFVDLTGIARQSFVDYVQLRFYAAPVALFNLLLVGFLVGYQQTRFVLYTQVGVNVLNIVLNVLLVFVFDLGVKGVAIATICAELTLCLISFAKIRQLAQPYTWLSSHWATFTQFKRILGLHRDLFLRSVILQGCLGFLIYQGARFGEIDAATNAILMQLFIFVALGLDGIAYAIEAMIGEGKGARQQSRLWGDIRISFMWSSIIALVTSVLVALLYSSALTLFTNQPSVIDNAQQYYWIMVLMPVVANVCYCCDGIYIGMTLAKTMRNSMLISAGIGFFAVAWLLRDWQNLGLWWALLSLQAMRGLTLSVDLWWRYRRDTVPVVNE